MGFQLELEILLKSHVAFQTPESRNSKTRSKTPTSQLPDILPPVKSSLSERSQSRNDTEVPNVAASRVRSNKHS